MKLMVFTVYDSAVAAYLQPFFCRSKGEALRSFSEACNDEKNNFHKHALDYSLFFLGEYDDVAGMFDASVPSRVVGASECIVDDPYGDDRRVSPPRMPM